MPLAINWLRVGPSEVTLRSSFSAMSPDRCGPAPSSAIARRYFFSTGVRRSNLTRKKLSSSAAMAVSEASWTSSILKLGKLQANAKPCNFHQIRLGFGAQKLLLHPQLLTTYFFFGWHSTHWNIEMSPRFIGCLNGSLALWHVSHFRSAKPPRSTGC